MVRTFILSFILILLSSPLLFSQEEMGIVDDDTPIYPAEHFESKRIGYDKGFTLASSSNYKITANSGILVLLESNEQEDVKMDKLFLDLSIELSSNSRAIVILYENKDGKPGKRIFEEKITSSANKVEIVVTEHNLTLPIEGLYVGIELIDETEYQQDYIEIDMINKKGGITFYQADDNWQLITEKTNLKGDWSDRVPKFGMEVKVLKEKFKATF